MYEFQLSKSIKNRQIKFASEDIEPQEALLDKLAQKKEDELGISGQKFEIPLSRKIIAGFWAISLVLFSFLLFKTFQLQVIQGKDLLQKAQNNKFIIAQVQSERGVIYDRNLNQLVFNKSAFDLILDKNNLPQEAGERNAVLEQVSKILTLSMEDLNAKIDSNENSIFVVSGNLSHEQLIILEAKIQDLPGFEIRQDWIREYVDGQNLSHVIGYLGKITGEELKEKEGYSVFDWVGRSGLEKTYEEYLKKNPGKLQIERDALGNEISRQITEQPSSGKSLVLWLDSGLQKKITEELQKTLERVGATKAAVVALDPKTGGVLSLISVPTFDNNLFQKGADQKSLQELLTDPQEPLFNRAVAGRYLTGSTIKPLIASAALQENLISPNKEIYDGGYITVPNQYDPEIVYKFSGIKPHGWVNMREALAVSSNIYFFTVGGGYEDQKGLGPTNIKKYLDLFGWEEKTGIDLPGETVGFVPDASWKKKTLNEGWWDGDTYNLSIGQGYLQITPLELANSFAAIANGGTLYKPHVVQKIIDDSSEKTETVGEISPEIIRENFIDSENLQIVREGMRLGVTGVNTPDALATFLNSLPMSAAVKTGTAELGNDYNNNWISVFAPYDDPQIVLTVVIQGVKGLQSATVPLAKEILQWYFTEGGGGGAQQ